jgi:hypothetical protein
MIRLRLGRFVVEDKGLKLRCGSREVAYLRKAYLRVTNLAEFHIPIPAGLHGFRVMYRLGPIFLVGPTKLQCAHTKYCVASQNLDPDVMWQLPISIRRTRVD